MASRATEKIMEALSQLLEGFAELQDTLDTEYGEADDVDDEKAADDDDVVVDPDSLIVKELKLAIEGSIETDDYTPEEIANLIAALTEALEEVDPNIFADADDEEEEEEEDEDEDDYDDDDLDLDEDDVEEEEEIEEEEEEDEDEAPRSKKKKR